MNPFPHLRAALLACIGLLAFSGSAQALDLELYAKLLNSHTRAVEDTAGTRVDYAGLKGSAEWAKLLASVSGSDPALLSSRKEKLAFWINAYNILAIEMVRANHPVDSIRDVGSFLFPVWDREAGRIHGRAYALGEIEHEILRPLGDPRIHAAIVCASTSCPSLRREPFTAQRLDAQLDDSLRAFLADTRKGVRAEARRGVRAEAKNGRLRVSRIFDWFEEDFEKKGGVVKYLQPYMTGEAAELLKGRGADIPLVYFDYDWTVNDYER